MNYTEGQMKVLEEDAGLEALTEQIWQNFNFKSCCIEQQKKHLGMSDDLSLLKQEPKTAPVLGGDLYRFLPFVQVTSFLNSHLIFVKISLKLFEGEFSQDNIGVG